MYRSPRTLRPQLGLGAVTRQPAAKTRIQQGAKVSTAGQQDLGGEMVKCWHDVLQDDRTGSDLFPTASSAY